MSMRKALVVGIDHYDQDSSLHGCVKDAHAINQVLSCHSNGTKNFGVKMLTGTGPADRVTRGQLREAVKELFADDNEIALLYFAGHGSVDATGGFLVTSDAQHADPGLNLAEVVAWAGQSKTQNRIIVLDCCHAGAAGNRPGDNRCAEIVEGMTILSSSATSQYAKETNSGGVFTGLFVDALNGGAANLVGAVTPGSVYAYVDQSLGEWDQRPVFKTNVKEFVSLRTVEAPIPHSYLMRLPEFFPEPDHEFALDPSFEPQSDAPDPQHTADFAVLQAYNRVNLVVPVEADHMFFAAMQSKSCKLTVRGEHYRRLAVDGRL